MKLNRYKLRIGSEKLLTRRERRFRPLIRSEMVPLFLHRNGEQAERNEAELAQFEERRAGNHHQTHYASEPSTYNITGIPE